MSILAEITEAVGAYNRFVADRVRAARTNVEFQKELLERWHEISSRIETVTTPTGLPLPRLALPQTDEPGEIARYLFGEGLPGEFPFANSAYREMYVEKIEMAKRDTRITSPEEPTRLFAGLGLAEDTNGRFHYLAKHQKHVRLSTAFDGPTLYGLDSDHEGLLGKVGEGGVAIDTVEDMERLYAGFDLADPHSSVSMT